MAALIFCMAGGLAEQATPATHHQGAAGAVWKRSMGLDSTKSVSLDKARLLFPTAELDRKKDHNRAEALLLAEYSRRTFNTGKAAS